MQYQRINQSNLTSFNENIESISPSKYATGVIFTHEEELILEKYLLHSCQTIYVSKHHKTGF